MSAALPILLIYFLLQQNAYFMNALHHLDLFSGIGGFALAARWTGRIETVAFCDNDPFCQRILHNHWPHALLYEDIRSLTANRLRSDGVPRIDLLTGGFPCQPFSIAGKRGGAADDRHLWPQMRRLIAETRPRWIIGENVAHFIPLALDACLSDLEAEGYEAWPLVLPACAVGAPHRRDRVFIIAFREDIDRNGRQTSLSSLSRAVADSNGFQLEQLSPLVNPEGTSSKPARASTIGGAGTIAGTGAGEQRENLPFQSRTAGAERRRNDEANSGDWWAIEPAVGRMAYGIPRRLDRLRSLGNAVVPQVVFPILNAIVEWEVGSGHLANDG